MDSRKPINTTRMRSVAKPLQLFSLCKVTQCTLYANYSSTTALLDKFNKSYRKVTVLKYWYCLLKATDCKLYFKAANAKSL